jgi:hypothetical protein
VKKFCLLLPLFFIFINCRRQYIKTDIEENSLPSVKSKLVVSYSIDSFPQLFLSFSSQKPYLRLQKDIYKRSYVTGRWEGPKDERRYLTAVSCIGCLGGSLIGTGLYVLTGYLDFLFFPLAVVPLYFGLKHFYPPFSVEVKQDTVFKDLKKDGYFENVVRNIVWKVGNSPKNFLSIPVDGKIMVYLKDFYQWVPRSNDMIIHFTSEQDFGSVDVVIPAPIVDSARVIENEAQKLFTKAQSFEERGDYEGALSLYKDILNFYRYSSVAKDLDDKIADLETVVRKKVLDRIAGQNLYYLAKFGLTTHEIFLIESRLKELEDGVRFSVVTMGLKLEFREPTEGIRFFNHLTQYQQLYALMLLAEEFATQTSNSSTKWFVKRGMLKDWFLFAHIADLLVEIEASQLVK